MTKYQPLKPGHQFGRLIVIGINKTKKGQYYVCKCKCGNIKSVYKYDLLHGKSKSCGCVTREKSRERCKQRNYKHGLGNTRLCSIWSDMKRRCYNPSYIDYKIYGARGIVVCDEWLNDFVSFYNWAVSHGYKDNLTIDRIDVNGNYEPNNCRWATVKEQANNKRNNRFVVWNGVKKTISQWAEKTGISVGNIKYRLQKGWSVERTLTQEVRK